jgi:hypothetical protein
MGCVLYDSSGNTLSNTLEMNTCIDRCGIRYNSGMGTTTLQRFKSCEDNSTLIIQVSLTFGENHWFDACL